MERRLGREMEEKEMLPDNQAGFRKDRGILDNIYVLNYVINRELQRKKEGVYAFFVDLRAADSVDRGNYGKH